MPQRCKRHSNSMLYDGHHDLMIEYAHLSAKRTVLLGCERLVLELGSVVLELFHIDL